MNYYEILEIRENASQEVIRASYKILAQKYHPDKNKTEEASEKMKLINVAYATLSDEEKKNKYDSSLADQKRRKQEAEDQDRQKESAEKRKEKEAAEKAKKEAEEQAKHKEELKSGIIIEESRIIAKGKEISQEDFYGLSFEINKENNFLYVYFWFRDNTVITINTKESINGLKNTKMLESLEEFYKHKMIIWFINKITENKGFNYNNIIEFASTGIYLLSSSSIVEENLFIKYEDVIIQKKFNKQEPFFTIKSATNELVEHVIIRLQKDNINNLVLGDIFDFLKKNNPILKQFTKNEKKFYKAIEKKNKKIEKIEATYINEEEIREENINKKVSFKRNFNFKTGFILFSYSMVVFFIADFMLDFTNLGLKKGLNFNVASVKHLKQKEDVLEKFEVYKKSGDFKNLYNELLGFSKSGDVRVYNYLGIMRLNGWGIEKNINEAIKWFSLASNQKDMFAKSQLGSIYLFGYGGSKNYFLAKNYFTEASEGGEINAINNLGVMYSNGLGVNKDNNKALEYFEKGIGKNNPVSLFNAALILKEKDPLKYKEYIKRSADMNFELAKKELLKIKDNK